MQIRIANIIRGTLIGNTMSVLTRYISRVVNGGGIVEKPQCVETALNSQSILQQASLLVVPSGYKGGTLYSEIPTNGNGDLTWTRGSDAFRTNASGVLQRVPWNLITYSEDFTNVVWSKEQITVTANSTTAPNSTITADTLVENTTNAVHRASYYPANTISGSSYTMSLYLKNNGRRYLYINCRNAFNAGSTFDLQNGTVSTVGIGTASIENIGNGWYRCSVTGTCTTTGAYSMYYQLNNSGVATDTTYTGDGTSGAFIWGAQLVEGTTAQTYLPTTDRLNFPRLSYMYGSCPSALLEPQRTNVVLWSSDLSQSVWAKANYTLTSATAIQGLTATRITKNATNNGLYAGSGSRNVINSVGAFASGTKAFSVLLRKGNTAKVGLLINQILIGASVSASCEFDFATETFTNISSGLTATFEKPTTDVYRLILVVNETGTGTSKALWIAPIDSSNNTVTDGYVDVAYFQWELGAFQTTYIPTTSATATRIADSFSRSNIYTNGLISASGGTWFFELRNNISYTRDSVMYIGVGDTSTLNNNAIFIMPGVTSLSVLRKRIAGTESVLYITTTTTTKIAVKWNGTSCDVFANGTKVVSASPFTTTNMEWFAGNATAVPMFIQQMALFPTPISDTDCELLTGTSYSSYESMATALGYYVI